MRTLKIIIKNLFHDPEFKLQIDNFKKNIIDLEENDGEKYICSNEEKNNFSNEDVEALKQYLRKKLQMQE